MYDESHPDIDISLGGEVLRYTYDGLSPRSVLGRIELDGIAGNAQYAIRVFLNDRRVSPDSIVMVPSSTTSVAMQSRELLLRNGDELLIVVDGEAEDTSVVAMSSLIDMTPATMAELRGDGEVEIDHNYGGNDALRITTAGGVGIAGATIQCFTAEDYGLGNRGAEFVIATTQTNSTGRWQHALMLGAGAYVLRVFKAGAFAPASHDLEVA